MPLTVADLHSATRDGIAADNSTLNWEVGDRLAVNEIRSVIQTHDGYLWLGTVDGVDRYDGLHLKAYSKSKFPQLPSNLISCLFEDHSYTLWLGCEDGRLAHMADGNFETISLPNEWSTAAITQILEDGNGTLWVLNQAGEVLSIQNERAELMRLSPPEHRPENEVSTIRLVRDAGGVVWLSPHATLWEMTRETKTTRKFELPSGNQDPVVFAARAGGFWVMDGDHLRRWTNGQWMDDRGRHEASGFAKRLALEAPSGHILIPSGESEILIINPAGGESRLRIQEGSAINKILSLCIDREGNVWMGTASHGLKVLRPRVVTMVDPPDHWLGREIVSVASGPQGELFIGTQKSGIYHYTHDIFTGMSQLGGQAASPVQSVCADSNAALWIGTLGDGLWRETQDSIERVGREENFPKQINAIFRSRAGVVWLGTEEGPARIIQGQVIPLVREFPTARGDVRCFAEGADGAVWVGMQGQGLGRLLNGHWSQFSKKEGLAGGTVWSLLADEDGSIWIGTYGAGIIRYEGGKFSSVSSKNGLPSDVICSIVDDQRGCLWMSSFSGIFRVAKKALRQCAESKDQQVSCQAFGFAEGLPTMEFTGGNQPCACRTRDGRLWFACNKGLAMIDPDAAQYNAVPPLIALEEVLVDGEAVDLGPVMQKHQPSGATFEVGPGRRHIEIRFAGLSFNSPERMQFRYRMKKLEKDWVEIGDRRSVYFSYLPPGDYTFEISARNNGGPWSEAGSPLNLVVHPFYWQTWWFLAGTGLMCSAAVALAAVGISRRREHRKREEMERQRAREIERTRIARDIHDQLGVGLTRISMLSLTAASRAALPELAQDNISEIQRTTKELTRSMDEIVWAVNPHHDTLDSLLTYLGEFARTFLASAEIRCRLDLPLDVPPIHISPEARHHVFLAFQESLNNVAKHGAATEVRVVAKLQEAELLLSVEDNGRGFDYIAGPNRENSGNGLRNMATRLRDIGGRFECDSRTGAGARIKLIIPIQR